MSQIQAIVVGFNEIAIVRLYLYYLYFCENWHNVQNQWVKHQSFWNWCCLRVFLDKIERTVNPAGVNIWQIPCLQIDTVILSCNEMIPSSCKNSEKLLSSFVCLPQHIHHPWWKCQQLESNWSSLLIRTQCGECQCKKVIRPVSD